MGFLKISNIKEKEKEIEIKLEIDQFYNKSELEYSLSLHSPVRGTIVNGYSIGHNYYYGSGENYQVLQSGIHPQYAYLFHSGQWELINSYNNENSIVSGYNSFGGVDITDVINSPNNINERQYPDLVRSELGILTTTGSDIIPEQIQFNSGQTYQARNVTMSGLEEGLSYYVTWTEV